MSLLNKLTRVRSANRMNRYPKLFNELEKIRNPKRILSYGCGFGEECFTLRQHFPNAYILGSDIQPKTIKKANSKNTDQNIEFKISDYDELAATEKFDMIFALNVFKRMHMSDEERAKVYPFEDFASQVRDLAQLCVSGGTFVITGCSYNVEDMPDFDKLFRVVECQSNDGSISNTPRCVYERI